MGDELVRAAQRGSEQALAELLQPLERKLYCMALGVVGNPHDAEDAWQNTVLKAWRQIRKLKNPALFRLWVTRILLNEANNILRQRARSPIPSAELPEGAAPQPVIEQFLGVQAHLQLIPEQQRQAVILRFWLDMPLDEIALTMDVPLSTAKTRLYQGIKSLRANMQTEGLGDGR
jgi:RNA polymerase sigma-70 factor (ECF subfamily)